jgi:hypothetical protein
MNQTKACRRQAVRSSGEMYSQARFHGESKNHHLTVSQGSKFRRVRQLVYNKKKGRNVTIEHYIEV